MKKNHLIGGVRLWAAVGILAVAHAYGSTYYVAVDGNDLNSGTMVLPFASLAKANAIVTAGDTVWIRGGVYNIVDTTYVRNDGMSAGIFLNKSGTSDDNRIHYMAYPGEQPIFDFSNLKIGQAYSHIGSVDSIMYTPGILIQARYLHLKGLEFRNVPMKYNSNVGVYIARSKHIFLEQINSHHNKGAGFFVNEKGTGSGGGHYFLNCDSHDNYDPNGRQGDGENADGFGVHYQSSGDTTRFYGCRAWWNSDDGWDFISQEFPVIVENSWAMGHGYSNYGTAKPANANGNGFKAGSSKTGNGRHIIKNCIAWKNKASGFYANHSSVGNYWYNNTAYSNGTAFNMWASTWDESDNRTDGVILTGDKAHIMKNNIAFPNKTAYIGGDYVSGEYNTWNLNITSAESDFLSVDDPSMTITGQDLSLIAGMLGPRQSDGSLPDLDFLKLTENSQMIDKGIDVGLSYTGSAPDLGSYEYGIILSSSSTEISSNSEDVAPESSSAMAMLSSSVETESISSSSETVTSILATRPDAFIPHEEMQVFDAQGKFLGGRIPSQAGIYLVRQGNSIFRIRKR